MERNGEMPDRRVADRRVVAVAGSDPAVAKENAVQQAQNWAFEAKTQRGIVISILKALGLPEQDYNALPLVLAHIESIKAGVPSVDRNSMPRAPTEAMLIAARDWSVKKMGMGVGNGPATECWQAMYDAAPQPVDAAQAVPEAIMKIEPKINSTFFGNDKRMFEMGFYKARDEIVTLLAAPSLAAQPPAQGAVSITGSADVGGFRGCVTTSQNFPDDDAAWATLQPVVVAPLVVDAPQAVQESPYAKALEKLLGTQSVPRMTEEPLEAWAFRALTEALVAQPAAQATITGAMLSAAGRALADRSAAACNVDKDDNWMVYGNDFIDDAEAALIAAGLTIAQPTDTTEGE